MDRRSALQMLAAASAGPLFNPQQELTFRSDVGLVLLDVSVKDNQGRFVSGLGKESFSVFEDGQLQRITLFDPEDRPATMGILLDESHSMTPKRPEVLVAARALIEKSNPMDEVFILHFNETVVPGLPAAVPFSSDTKALLAALSREVPPGNTALFDGVCEGLKRLRLGRRDKKALVLISDGGDNASRRSREETLAMVERSNATIYAIGLYVEDVPSNDTAFLRRIAKTSGGVAYLPSTTDEMLSVCRRIAGEIRTRYTVGYVPSDTRGAKSLRRIEVRARDHRHGKLIVRTRSGYQRDESHPSE